MRWTKMASYQGKLDLRFHKLDGRFKGNDMFTWMCTLYTLPTHERFTPFPTAHSELDKIIKFNKLRDWCWDTWGPSCDLKDYDRIHEITTLSQYNDNGEGEYLNEQWCWSNEDNHKQRRIYLGTNAERIWLETRWR